MFDQPFLYYHVNGRRKWETPITAKSDPRESGHNDTDRFSPMPVFVNDEATYKKVINPYESVSRFSVERGYVNETPFELHTGRLS